MLEGLKTVGTRMAFLRAMGNLSQKDLSKLCEINLTSIENIECGRTALKKEQATQIVKALKCIGIPTSVDWIMDGSPLIPSTLNFSDTNVFYSVCSIMNSTTKLIINEQNEFLKTDSIVLASEIDISKIADEPFIIIKHNDAVFACKASISNPKILYKKGDGEAIEFNDEMTAYFPSIIIMKQQ
jgi:transcriptional regulator with XRE-family HTH domain